MALSPSASSALKLAALWLGMAGLGAAGMMNADLVRDMLGLRLELNEPAPPTNLAHDAHSEPDERDTRRSALGRSVQLKAGAYGHFHSRIYVNGRAVDAMVDTGASIVALTYEDARTAGIHIRESDFTHRVSTANGIARVAMVTLESVALQDIEVRDVRAAVAEPGKLTTTLLGMSFLGQLRRAEMSRGVLLLED